MTDPEQTPSLEPGARRGSLPLALVSIALLAAALAGGAALITRAQKTERWRMRFGSRSERVQVIGAIAARKGDDAALRLGPMLDDPSPDIRLAALDGLAAVRGNSELWRVVDLVTYDDDPEVRTKAVRFCAASRDRTCLERITPALDDESPEVRIEAILAMSALGATSQRVRVTEFLSDPDRRIRTAAVEALGRIGTKEEAMLLAAMLRNEKAVPRAVIRSSLASITGVDKGFSSQDWTGYLLENE